MNPCTMHSSEELSESLSQRRQRQYNSLTSESYPEINLYVNSAQLSVDDEDTHKSKPTESQIKNFDKSGPHESKHYA